MAREGFRAFLTRSLQLLAAEAPAQLRRLGAELGRAPVTLWVDDAPCVLQLSPSGRWRIAETGPAEVELRTTRRTILALVDGELGLLEALRSDRLLLRGPVEALPRVIDGLHAYLHGVVRSPSHERLLLDYRRPTQETSCPNAP